MLKIRYAALAALLLNLLCNHMLADLTLLGYAVYSLKDSQRAHDRIAPPLLAYSLFALFHQPVLMLVAAVFMFRPALELRPRVAAVPFSLTLGWLTLATLNGLPAVPALLLVGCLGIWMNHHYESLVYPAVLAWGAFTVAFAYRSDSLAVHLTALTVAVVLVAWISVAVPRGLVIATH
jgi:hypothetical protein